MSKSDTKEETPFNLIQAIKERKLVSSEIVLNFPEQDPQVQLTIIRPPQEALTNIRHNAMIKSGEYRQGAQLSVQLGEENLALYTLVKTLVKSWSLDEEFNDENKKALFDVIEQNGDHYGLGASLRKALSEDNDSAGKP